MAEEKDLVLSVTAERDDDAILPRQHMLDAESEHFKIEYHHVLPVGISMTYRGTGDAVTRQYTIKPSALISALLTQIYAEEKNALPS